MRVWRRLVVTNDRAHNSGAHRLIVLDAGSVPRLSARRAQQHTDDPMRCLFEPLLVNEAFGDPSLYIDFRDERRALLVDLGDISALPPRKLLRLSHVFVTHTHMDHFSGFDHLLRVVLGRKAGIVLFGGPDFVAQVEHKLRAYSWNVVHRYEVELVLDVREIGIDGRGRRACFSSRTGFARTASAQFQLHDDVLHEEALFRVRARFVDHGLPCLAFAIEEKAHVKLAKDRLARSGYRPVHGCASSSRRSSPERPARPPFWCNGAIGMGRTP